MKRKLLIKRNLKRKEKNSVKETDFDKESSTSKFTTNFILKDRTVTIISRKQNEASIGTSKVNSRDYSINPKKNDNTNASLVESSS